MTGIEPLRIMAEIDRAEHEAVKMAATLLSQSLRVAQPDAAPAIKLALRPPGAPLKAEASPHALVISLLPDLARQREAKADCVRRWTDRLAAMQDSADLVFLCTIFRHVSGRDRAGGPNETLVRIRELNLMAVELSHALGIAVIDIDRALAHYGARMLQTDYRLGGESAALAAGHTIASAILAGGLDDRIEPELQEAARALLGGVEKVPVLIARHQQLKQQGGSPRG